MDVRWLSPLVSVLTLAAALVLGGPLLLLFVFILARKCACCGPRWLKLWWRGTAPPPLPILMSEWRWEWWRATETLLPPGLSGITCCWSGVEEEEEEEEGMEVEEVGLLEDEEEEEEEVAEDDVEF